VPASLESVHRQLNAKLEESASAEFNEIVREREVVRGLNELDRLVGEARRRKDRGEEEGGVAVQYVEYSVFSSVFWTVWCGSLLIIIFFFLEDIGRTCSEQRDCIRLI
jgi:hypothetical protein